MTNLSLSGVFYGEEDGKSTYESREYIKWDTRLVNTIREKLQAVRERIRWLFNKDGDELIPVNRVEEEWRQFNEVLSHLDSLIENQYLL